MMEIPRDILEEMEDLSVARECDPDSSVGPPISSGGRRAVFLDRDGVMVEEGSKDSLRSRPVLIEGLKNALRSFRNMGYLIVVATNQGHIGKGNIDHRDMMEHFIGIKEALGMEDPWDRAYYCPYHAEAEIDHYRRCHICRKPDPGMLYRAAREMDIDLTSSVMVGDKLTDVMAAHAAGSKGILVTTGNGKKELRELVESGYHQEIRPDAVVQDIGYAMMAIREELI